MSTREHPARTPPTRNGYFATLRAFFRLQSTGAPSSGFNRRASLAITFLGLALLLAALTAPPAFANYENVSSFSTANSRGLAANDTTGDLYVAGEMGSDVLRYDSHGQFLEDWGYNTVATGPDKAGANRVATVTVTATAGKFTLNVFNPVNNGGRGESTGEISATATHQEVQEAIEALPGLKGAGDYLVTGGPGDAAGTTPYTVEFTGAVGGEPFSAYPTGQNISLSGGSPTSSITTATVTEGSYAYETCAPARGDLCRHPGQSGEALAQFVQPRGIAVDQSTGDVYVLDAGRRHGVVQVFGPDGSYITSFGEKGTGSLLAEPEAIHGVNKSGIAVDSAGDVYLSDQYGFNPGEDRVMVFRPKTPGDYSEYRYAVGDDIATGFGPIELAIDAAGDLYFNSNEHGIDKFSPAEPVQPLWEHVEPSGNVEGLAVDPLTGESFYYTAAGHHYRRLAPDGQLLATFEGLSHQESPGLAFNPTARYEPNRPPGILYAINFEDVHSPGLILAPAVVHSPAVASTSVSGVASTSATLRAAVDPRGSDTTYRFSYLPESAYLANRPDTEQSLAVSAQSGTFTLTATTGEGEAAFSAATGTGKLTAGSREVTSLSTVTGAFAPGQSISGPGIPAGVTVAKLAAGSLELSAPATVSVTGAALQAGSSQVSGLITNLGSLHPGDTVAAAGLPLGTKVLSVNADSLTLSQDAALGGEQTFTAYETTAPIAFDAPATGPGSVQAALDALPGVDPLGLPATGPALAEEAGSASEHDYAIAFSAGPLAGLDLPLLTADSSALSGASHTATLTLTHHGGGGFSGAAEAPLSGADLGSAQENLAATTTVSGLTPDTSYRFQLTAVSHCEPAEPVHECTATGPIAAFHTYSAPTGLPDRRAYELVSPPDKSGGEVFPPLVGTGTGHCGEYCNPGAVFHQAPMQSSPDGDSVVYQGSPFCAVPGQAPICPPGTGAANENSYLSTRTSAGWRTTDLSPELSQKNLASGNGFKVFSADLSRGLLAQFSGPTLSSQAPAGLPDLYSQSTADPAALSPLLGFQPPSRPAAQFAVAYAGASADLSRLFFTANDALTEEASFAPAPQPGESNLYESHDGRLSLLGVLPGDEFTAPGAAYAGASADGRRVFFTAAGRLYARIDGEETLEVADPGHGHFLAASADGSRLLLDDGCLYSLAAEECEADLTEAEGDHEGGFLGTLGASEDLSSVYFVDTKVLTGEQLNGQGLAAASGQDNLYLYRRGAPTVFIAGLAAADGGNQAALGLGGVGFSTGDWSPSPSDRTAQVTPDGRYLAFDSAASLTGSENAGDIQVYEYDSAAARLSCVSCNPSGARPLGLSTLSFIRPQAGSAFPQPHDLTASGRLFFDSGDALSPADHNGPVQDVYEWEPQGVGTCTSAPQNGGCLSLLSSGQGSTDAYFLDATPSGSDAFFTTRDQLLPSDTDDLVDLYDAREDGGIEEQSGSQPCAGETCKSPPSNSASESPVGSEHYSGSGNVAERPSTSCKKGLVKKHGRCVKKAHKHHNSHKRHHRRANHYRGGAR